MTGLSDYDEIHTYGTDPFNIDTDGDGLQDGAEVVQYGTNPNSTDTDGDAMPDTTHLLRGKRLNRDERIPFFHFPNLLVAATGFN